MSDATANDLVILTAFGERVRRRRDEQGLTQEALAERAGLHRTYVGSVERGERNVSLVNIVKLAAALEMDPGDLVSTQRAQLREVALTSERPDTLGVGQGEDAV